MFKHTLITFNPKAKHANNISNFRPISFCTICYKVISKLLANKLKLTLPYIISNMQFAFIKGRDIYDNISLSQQLCGELFSSKHVKAFYAKINLKNAFDIINHTTILIRLSQLGFPTLFIDWIKACIIDTPFFIICNGSISRFFYSSNGLRQGCALSSFLFNIVMDLFLKTYGKGGDGS